MERRKESLVRRRRERLEALRQVVAHPKQGVSGHKAKKRPSQVRDHW